MVGVAFKQHLLYTLVSVECCGGIELHFSMLVLSLTHGNHALHDYFMPFFLTSSGFIFDCGQTENQQGFLSVINRHKV